MFKKKDIVLAAAVILTAVGMALVIYQGQGKNGEMVRIMVDGSEYGTYAITENKTIEIENELGYNCIVIENGSVFMKSADCPDKYCVEHRAITKANETIVCLPHKLVVEVHTETDNNNIDSIAQ